MNLTTFTVTEDLNKNAITLDTKDLAHQTAVMQKRLADKDDFISVLEKENQDLRQLYARQAEELVNIQKVSQVLDNLNTQHTSNQNTSIDESVLVDKVLESLKNKNSEEIKQSNYQTVYNALLASFGDKNKIEERIASVAKDLSISVGDLVETAKKSPSAFWKLTGLNDSHNSFRSTKSDEIMDNNSTTTKDAAYYAKLRRENPREYWKPSTQAEFRKLFIKK